MNELNTTLTIEQYDLVHTCRKCDRVCLEKGNWVDADKIEINLEDSSLSHGICPNCIRAANPDFSTQMFKKVDGEMVILDATDLVHA
ncbi:MAG: hypothetical protein ACPGVU_17120 [Limisphaerales bacterium]